MNHFLRNAFVVLLFLAVLLSALAWHYNFNPIAVTQRQTLSAQEAQDQIEYLDKFIQFRTQQSEFLASLQYMFANPELTDEVWRTFVLIKLELMRISYRNFRKITPPDGLREIHELELDSINTCYLAADYVETGIRSRSDADLFMGATLVTSCSEKIVEVNKKLDLLMPKQKRSISR